MILGILLMGFLLILFLRLLSLLGKNFVYIKRFNGHVFSAFLIISITFNHFSTAAKFRLEKGIFDRGNAVKFLYGKVNSKS